MCVCVFRLCVSHGGGGGGRIFFLHNCLAIFAKKNPRSALVKESIKVVSALYMCKQVHPGKGR